MRATQEASGDGIERIELARSRDAIDLEERRAGDRRRRRRHITRLDQPCLEAESPGLDCEGEGLRHLHRIAGLCHRRVEQHGVIAELHRFRSLRRRATPASMISVVSK